MIKELLTTLDLSLWAEIPLAIFATAFVVIAIRTLATDRGLIDRQAAVVLGDEAKEQR